MLTYNRWLYLFLGVLLAFFMGMLVERSYHTYRWAGKVNVQAEYAAGYLFAPTGIKDPNGKEFSRADLLDALIKERLSKNGR